VTNLKFSIIIPTYNRARLLNECINSINNQKIKHFEIIIIDNGSTDDTQKAVMNYKSKNKIRYYHQCNKGAASARNLGLEKAKGQIICFTDDDCIVDKNWLINIKKTFDKTNSDAVGGSIINKTNSYIANSQYLLNFSSWMPTVKKGYVKDIPTCNIAYKKRSIKGMKFIEQKKGVGYTDTLFNMEMIKNNKRIYFNPKIKVIHNTWKYSQLDIKKFFEIQKRAALGFINGGYQAHEKIGEILMKHRWLNFFCPRLINVLKRGVLHKSLIKMIIYFPFIFIGEFYRNIIIIFPKR